MKIKELKGFVKFLVGKDVISITLAPFGIYVNESNFNNETTINHERIHWKQQMEMLILPFYIWYLLEWFIKLFKYTDEAYYNISFEREAYTNEKNFQYLYYRKHYSWLKYIFK
jgi:hypothetical protein